MQFGEYKQWPMVVSNQRARRVSEENGFQFVLIKFELTVVEKIKADLGNSKQVNQFFFFLKC